MERAPVPGRAWPDHPPAGRLHQGQVSFQIDFDFVDHRLVVQTNGGQQESFRLQDGLSVAAFDRQLHELLDQLGVDVAIREDPTVCR